MSETDADLCTLPVTLAEKALLDKSNRAFSVMRFRHLSDSLVVANTSVNASDT